MATRSERLGEFITEGHPTSGKPHQLLCEDHCGTYVLPYSCLWRDGVWQNIRSGHQIEADVVGWRAAAR
jgi:hypothetical protein